MTFSNFMVEAAKIFLPILGTLLTFLIAMLIDWVKTKTKNKKLQDYLCELGQIIIAVVKEIQQTIVDDLKDPAKDGEWTTEMEKVILKRALLRVKAKLPLYILTFLEGIYSDLNGLIITKIEERIYDKEPSGFVE